MKTLIVSHGARESNLQLRLFYTDKLDRWAYAKPIREAVTKALSNGITKSEICKRLDWGWARKNARAETGRLDQALGFKNDKKTMKYDNAVKIIRAIGLDPVDFNL